MIRFLLSFILSGILLISAACSTGSLTTQAVDEVNSMGQEEIDGGQLLAEGIGPLVITRAPGENGELPSLPGVVDSDGDETQGGAYGGEPGRIGSTAPEELSFEDYQQEIDWLTYQDQAHNFSIIYPHIYTVLPESGQPQSGILHRVRFYDMGSSLETNLDLPQFTIEIFDPNKNSLEEFIERDTQGSQLEIFDQDGLHGFRINFSTLIAPNEIYYLTDDNLVYKLIPLGPYSQEMLESFQLLH